GGGGNDMTTIDPHVGLRSERLARVVASTLRVPLACVGAFDTFLSLGMDSLAAVELTAAIEDELDIKLALTAVHEYPTLDALCRYLDRAADNDADTLRREQRAADAELPFDIVPETGAGLTRDARRVLLTGATGFLGAYLLRTLLTETQATVYCLVRPGLLDGFTRVRRNLTRYGLWSDA